MKRVGSAAVDRDDELDDAVDAGGDEGPASGVVRPEDPDFSSDLFSPMREKARCCELKPTEELDAELDASPVPILRLAASASKMASSHCSQSADSG